MIGRDAGAELADPSGNCPCDCSSRIARSTVVTRCFGAGASLVRLSTSSSALGDKVGGEVLYGGTGGDAPPLLELRLAFEELRRFLGVNVRMSSSSSASERADEPCCTARVSFCGEGVVEGARATESVMTGVGGMTLTAWTFGRTPFVG